MRGGRPTEGDEAQPQYGHLGRAEPLVNPIRDGSGFLLWKGLEPEMKSSWGKRRWIGVAIIVVVVAGVLAVSLPLAGGKSLAGRLFASGSSPTPTPTKVHTSGGGTIPGNPEDTSSNVHLGMGSINYVTNCCAALERVRPPVTNVWDWNNGDPSLSSSVDKGYYFPADRQPDFTYTPNAKRLPWFKAKHPDWLEYKCNRTSLAYAFGDKTYIPLDVANPAVLSWLEQTFWGPIAASGTYQELGLDNFVLTNGGDWSGQRCGHYDTNGHWIQQFNGTNNDPAYRAYMIQLATNIRIWLHRSYPNVAFAPNFSYDDNFPTDSDALTRQADILLDEQGWTNGENAPPWQFLDGAWVDKAQHLWSYLSQAGHGWIDQNHEPVNGTITTSAQRQWAIGNYLLFKNSHSWMFIDGPSDGGQLVILPEYAAATVGTPTDSYYANQGIYRRDFTAGLVLVNPSSRHSFTVSLPARAYADLSGTKHRGNVTLEPGRALVLVTAGA